MQAYLAQKDALAGSILKLQDAVRALASPPGEHPYLQPVRPMTELPSRGAQLGPTDLPRKPVAEPIVVKPIAPVTVERPAWLDSIKPPSWVNEMATHREAAMPAFPAIQIDTNTLEGIPATFSSVFGAGAESISGAGASAAAQFAAGIGGTRRSSRSKCSCSLR